MSTNNALNTISLGSSVSGSGGVVVGDTGATILTPDLTGITSGSSAASGIVGQIISSTVLDASGLTLSSSATDITSISLTAGDWDVFANVNFNISAACALASCWVSATSATAPDKSLYNTIDNGSNLIITTCGMITPFVRANISGTTTYYLSALIDGLGGAAKGSGTLWARRRR